MRRHHAQAASRTASEPNLLPTRPLTALLLADGKPGHYHQAEGVIAAIGRMRPVTTVRLEVRRRFVVPTRTLAAAGEPRRLPGADPAPGLRHPCGHAARRGRGRFRRRRDAGSQCGGGQAAGCAQHLLRPAAPARRPSTCKLVIVSPGAVRRAAQSSRRPCRPRRSTREPRLRTATAPRSASGAPIRPPEIGVLIGGNSGAHRYGAEDWQQLISFLQDAHRAHGMRWLAATSRRSGSFIGDALAAMAARGESGLDTFVDFRTAGAGTLPQIFAAADAILCTDDSTTMISEAVGARLPVVSVAPADVRARGARGRVPRLPRGRGLVSLAAAVAADARHASWPRWRRSRRAPAASWTSWRRR